MRILYLSNNQLTTLPESFGNLNLTKLNLDDRPILLEPIQDEYFFRSNKLLNTIKKRFNIDEYNKLLRVKERNWDARKSSAVMSDGLHKFYSQTPLSPNTEH